MGAKCTIFSTGWKVEANIRVSTRKTTWLEAVRQTGTCFPQAAPTSLGMDAFHCLC